MSAIIEKTTSFVEDLYLKDLPGSYIYHNYALTETIVKSTEEIIKKTKIDANESEILVLASLLHNTGYTKSRENHEEFSVSIATDFLSSEGVVKETIDAVNDCILATKLDVTPETKLHKIMKDATTVMYGKKKYLSFLEQLRQEMELHDVVFESDADWLNLQIKRLTVKHTYYSDYAVKKWKPAKEKNVAKLLKAKTKIRKESQKEKMKAKYKVKFKSEDPERGIQTFYRVALRNHIKLSDIADTKANILLSVNAIIISLILSNLISKLDNPSNDYMIIPTIIFILFSIASMALSIVATRPNVTSGTFTEEDIKRKNVNLSFFGNFHQMQLNDYERELKRMLKDKEYIYSALAKDLYFLGDVLNRKYKILRFTYTIFMTGIIVSVIAFAVMFKVQG